MRERTQKNTEEDVSPYLEYLFKKMEESNFNRINLVHVWVGAGLPWPSSGQETILLDKLRELGYTVKHNPDPDPGHPYSVGDYYSIHW